jgi:hypothetical protein
LLFALNRDRDDWDHGRWPAFDEEVSLGTVALITRRHDDRVIVVDDCGSEQTAEAAELVSRPRRYESGKQGKGSGLKNGPDRQSGYPQSNSSAL